MRLLIKFALFVVVFFAAGRFCKTKTGSFTVSRITSSLPYAARWDVACNSDMLSSIMSQPYTYLGKGVQTFVFASQDGKYVIKFLRHDRLGAPGWMRQLPFGWARQRLAKNDGKLEKDFTSYKIAFEELKEETGMVFLHLNKTSHLRLSIDLVDKLGIHHHLPLDHYEFMVQKRAQLIYPSLEQMSLADAKLAISKLVKLLAHRAQKGIFDKDPDLNTNFGFIGIEPMQIDAGRFRKKEMPFDKNEIVRITDNLHQWLEKRCPELDAHLKAELEKL